MTIKYFAAGQNAVFIPALLCLLVATIAICLPIMFGVGLRRRNRFGRALTVGIVVGVLAAGVAVLPAAAAFHTLGAERDRVQATLKGRYGIDLTPAEIGQVIDGGKVKHPDVALAKRVGLATPGKAYTVELVVTTAGADTYTVEYGEKPVPPQA